jgi:uncharacterized membrane protein YhaH (DUF805 family)
MSFFEAINTCLVKKYFTFSGRATRSEFWWFQLFITLVYFISISVGFFFMENLNIEEGMPIIFGTTVALLVIPTLAVQVRRLHDVGRSGWFLLISLIPYIGGFVLFIQYLLPSVPESLDEVKQATEQ